MKRRSFLPPALFLLCSLLVIAAAAAGGDASDPLVSLSHLQGAFTKTVDSRLDSALTASDAALKARAGSGTPSDTAASAAADTWTERRLKNGDTLSGGTGLNVLLLAGEAKVSFPSGAVVDVTEGKEVPSGTALAKDHRYLVAEDTVATFIVSSRTAVLDYMGLGTFTFSDAVDYNAMASALKTMHLFRGSFTGFGQGFDLEMAPTRIQALIMFLRVLGEEDAALAYTGPALPFTDIQPGSNSAKYVGYAYAKGYTTGVEPTRFGSSTPVSTAQFLTLLLRALGYEDGKDFTWSTPWTLTDQLGITDGDYTAQTATFLRADAAVVSANALYAPKKGEDKTLLQDLLDSGAISGSTVVIWDYAPLLFDEDFASFLFYPVDGSPASFTSFKLDKVTVNGLSCQTLQVTTPEEVSAYLASIGYDAGGFGYVEITYDEDKAQAAATEHYTDENGKTYPLLAFSFTYTATQADGSQVKGSFTDNYYLDE